ncbi:bromodomain family [Trichomonas vaginalis G3]|uniref:bromodomain family n=1 Tax=Trichomonas vaginalis (strain ATCC PRA-98 / G3) TaxID=412133 RepID=UPI0021E53900|nr:bromodomain family [Trichomonas vaginalis G3]KAI5525645.1 bromodomain family [Trichomonas vaginalis G3]
MKEAQRTTCLEIVDIIIKHPISGPFRLPVNKELLPQYYEIVDDPQDLQTIRQNLENKEIRSIREFKRNMGLIWSNAILFNGKDSEYSNLARELQKTFEKLMLDKLPTSTTTWMERVNLYQNRLNHLIGNPPSNISDSVPIEALEPKSLIPLSAAEYKSLFSYATELPNEEDRAKLFKMLKKPKSVIDLTELSLKTLHDAMEFVKDLKNQRKRSAISAAAEQ